MFPVAEKFISINGEGTRAGETAVFIRFKGCNLNCSYCDTKWANCKDTSAVQFSAQEIVDWVISTGIRNVTLTGGEPLLQKELFQLTDLLLQNNLCVEIETNGSISLKELAERKYRPVFTMDYKLPFSGMEKFMDKENFSFLAKNDTVKFVAGSMEDLIRAEEIINTYSLCERCHVYFSPVFSEIDPKEIVEFMISHKLNDVRLQLQLHKYIWPPEMRGV